MAIASGHELSEAHAERCMTRVTAERHEPDKGEKRTHGRAGGGHVKGARGCIVPREPGLDLCPRDPCIDCDVPSEPSLDPCLRAVATTASAGDCVQPGSGLQIEVRGGGREPASEIECHGDGWPVIVPASPGLGKLDGFCNPHPRYAQFAVADVAMPRSQDFDAQSEQIEGGAGRCLPPTVVETQHEGIIGTPQARVPPGHQCATYPAEMEEGMYVLDFQGGGPDMATRESADGDAEGGRDQPLRGAGVWSSSSSGPPQPRNEAQAEAEFRVSVSSWNLAGASKKKVVGVATTVLVSDILAAQEYPKMSVGWHTTTHEHVSAVLRQDILMYRAVGVMYNNTKFSVLKRRKASKGIWVLLRHKESAREIWVGSVHLPVNDVVEELERFQSEFLNVLPATCSPCVLLGDFNTHFTWDMEKDVVAPKKLRSRWSKLKQGAAERGLEQVAPDEQDMRKPTFVSRKQGVAATQIDGMFCARCLTLPLRIHTDSRHEVGTDHERIAGEIVFRGKRVRQAKVAVGGPRQLTSVPPPQSEINDEKLADLAKQHTKMASLGPKFRMSDEARRLPGVAKTQRTPQAWKDYLSRLRGDKQQWKAERVERAAYDWGAYKQMTRNRVSWAEGYMISSTSEDPEREIVKHFKEVFHDADRVETVQQLQEIAQAVEAPVVTPFTCREVVVAFHQGKRGKAVGPDGVSLELLLALIENPLTLDAFVSYFNGILTSGAVPECWNTSVASLLPKVSQPTPPKSYDQSRSRATHPKPLRGCS